MNNRRFLFFALLIAYILAPALYSWIAQSEGTWLKPFFVWGLIVLGAFVFQTYRKTS